MWCVEGVYRRLHVQGTLPSAGADYVLFTEQSKPPNLRARQLGRDRSAWLQRDAGSNITMTASASDSRPSSRGRPLLEQCDVLKSCLENINLFDKTFGCRASMSMSDINAIPTFDLSIDLIDEWFSENANCQPVIPLDSTKEHVSSTGLVGGEETSIWQNQDNVQPAVCTCSCYVEIESLRLQVQQ